MIFLMKGCTFSVCHYYRNIISRSRLLELCYPLFLNLNKEVVPVNCQLFSLKSNFSVTDANIKTYLDCLMSVYQGENTKKGSISEILKLHEIPLLLNEKIKILDNIKNLADLVNNNNNEEMKNLANEEELIYKQQLSQLDEQILDTIVQYLNAEHFDGVIMEIMPGVGGQEAMLFVKNLFDMYVNYLDHLGYNYEIMELLKSDISGLRKVVLLISDGKAYRKLIYESGVHRVQRVPATEKSGRMHTSTAVVIIIPQPKDFTIKLENKDLKIDTMKASGAGGQHVNTTDSAVRVTHIPTGTVVTCQISRSQAENRKLALMKLKGMLYQNELDKQLSLISKMRKKQIGTKLRNEKIRTYNFNQDRVTDHRISDGTIYNLKEFMKDATALEILEDKLYNDLQYQAMTEIIEEMIRELK